MCLKAEAVEPVPEETARLARIVCPKGNLCIWMSDELGEVFQDELFTPLFPQRGQPAEAPWRLAMVTVLQCAEGLSDRQAAHAVRTRLDWKYALRLEMEDLGFDFSVLSEFRKRLVTGGGEHLLFEAMLQYAKARGWLHMRGRQRTDSTHVLAAIQTLSRLECGLCCKEKADLVQWGKRGPLHEQPKPKSVQVASFPGRHHSAVCALVPPICFELSRSRRNDG